LGVFSPPKDKVEIGKMTPLEYRQKMIDARAAKKAASADVGG
jgi:hypothetical protein